MILESLKQFLPIFILLLTVAIVLTRLPKVELGLSAAFKRRRLQNWLPLGLAYAFLYMGRYNLTVSKNAFGGLMTNADFGTIFGVGTIVYGFSFVINGPLTDKIGGKKAIFIATLGAAMANVLMGLVTFFHYTHNLKLTFSILYAANMYFQSFGAVSIVKVNSSWFHVRERGTFGGIFGILISLGLYFAYDWGGMIAKTLSLEWVFFVPALILMLFFMITWALVKDSPSEAGFEEIETGDVSSHHAGKQMSALQVGKMMFQNPIILTIACIEFCSGFLRNAIMHWYLIFSKQTGIAAGFVPKNWGILLCCAGILGGVFAGTISDKLFQSRRGPVCSFLYLIMFAGGITATFMLHSSYLGWLMVFLSMAIIGVHGMLSGTASMDFGGKYNVGTAVGIIDGMVYLGTALESLYYGAVLPNGDAAKIPENWSAWPVAMIPITLIGFLLTLRMWNAKPIPKQESKKEVKSKVFTASSRPAPEMTAN